MKLHPKRSAEPTAKCPRHPKKDWRPLVQAAWDAGWWVRKSRDYIYCYSPHNDYIVKVPMTPSDWRSMRNTMRDFRHGGLRL
jgi:hypothetical protein